MYITLISACQKRALRRTRAVLDSYALRIGDRFWKTPITGEGLQELRGLLRRSATRHTAVACYRNHGSHDMKLLWIVGSRVTFGENGLYPVGTRTRRRLTIPFWVRPAALLADMAGLTHDLGKTGQNFCDKLAAAVDSSRDAQGRDPVRHEWISMRLVQSQRARVDLEQAWPISLDWDAQRKSPGVSPRDLRHGLDDLDDALDYIILTHHKLLGPTQSGIWPNNEAHVYDDRARITCAVPPEQWPANLWADVLRRRCRIEALVTNNGSADFWRGIVWLARMAVILADHEVSAHRFRKNTPPRYFKTLDLYANTRPNERTGEPEYNQPLGWHLAEVARLAGDRVYRIGTLRLPRVSEETVEQLLDQTPVRGPYGWQGRALQAAQDLAGKSHESPVLVLNIAATGTGKTRANAMLACALRKRPRFAMALNLRTLTLQSGAALQKYGFGQDEVATVIGDRSTQRLHEWSKTIFDADENDITEEIEALGGEAETPPWLDHLLKQKPGWRSILSAPVLVSTVDFLVSAGEPGRQAHHVAAMLRLIDSDLVLDEIDSYDQKALVAVLRLVYVTAMLGRHVICSSATLPSPVAEAVRAAFVRGFNTYLALHQKTAEPRALLVHDRLAPKQVGLRERFEQRYRDYVENLLKPTRSHVYRKPYLQSVHTSKLEAWQQAVLMAVERLHHEHRWPFAETSKTISFGLVRVANIRTAIPLARMLAKRLPNARIACYHSQDLRLQRFHKERRLDWLLSRHQGNAHIEQDLEIKQIVNSAEVDSIPFILIATPAEEIGRDHDFDWGVLEPSSVHSLVQATGRINRHRLQTVHTPNIAILQYNARWARGEDPPYFMNPGLEQAGDTYPSADLEKLLDWPALDRIDSALRFDKRHTMTKHDDHFLKNGLKEPLKIICAEKGYESVWMTQAFYKKYALRDGLRSERWSVFISEHGAETVKRYNIDRNEWETCAEGDRWRQIGRARNDWLVLDAATLLDIYNDAGLEQQDALTIDMPADKKVSAFSMIYRDLSFGWYKESI